MEIEVIVKQTFNEKKYKTLLEHLDAYVIGCELSGINLDYNMYAPRWLNGMIKRNMYSIHIRTRELMNFNEKTNGFYININENKNSIVFIIKIH